MPKALSLKKASQSGPSKNQKSIISFFKSSAVDNSQKLTSPIKKRSEIDNKEFGKRKALSPVLIDTDEDDLQCFETNKYNSHKKLKTSQQNGTTSTKQQNKNVKPKSPNKENGQKRASPKKHNLKHDIEEPAKNLQIKSLPEDQMNGQTLENVNNIRRPMTPVTIENNEENNHEELCHKIVNKNQKSPSKNHVNIDAQKFKTSNSVTPKKGALQDFHCSPIDKLRTPEKLLQKLLSPSKSGSTVKALDFDDDNVGDLFGDEWEMGDIEEDQIEDLDLSTLQRCEVISVNNHGTRIELKLKNTNNNRATCFIEGIWLDTPLSPRDIISILATKDTGHYVVGNTSGLLVLRPDHLVSSTSVVAGVFCRRKAVLQERWKGIDSANHAMTIGILIHELVQKALTKNIASLARLRLEADMIIKESVQMLYDAGLSGNETRDSMQSYIGPLAEFMQNYVENDVKVQKDKNNWNGHVDKILDIEENLCCPQLGLKGKIDATLQVTIHDRKGPEKAVVPLELKSGKASVSAEHRGQLVLYGMMLAALHQHSPTHAVQRGLLLYLKERVELREVSCGYPERRDLIMLRNQMAQYLAPGPDTVDPEQLVDIEDASILLQQRLPEPVNNENACSKCAYLTLCSLHLWHTDGPSVSASHPLSKLRTTALGHLTAAHIEYFLKWTALLKMEERGQMNAAPLHALWTESVEKRTKRGTCTSNLTLKAVKPSQDRFLHVFVRKNADLGNENSKANSGPQEGEFSIVSIDKRPWIAAGVVTVAKQTEIQILLERDLSRRLSKETVYHIDTYESYATTVNNLTNLGVLMEDSERAERLRKLIIDKSPPQFEEKLPREVGRLGAKLMRSLNIQQQRAVLKALAARDYALLQGLPGTGKTQTISVLIQMLVALKQRVLVTAHTHSAVDTVLSRIPDTIKVMRLGSSARVAPSLSSRTELALIGSCDTPEKLDRLYNSMEVVGVTCLGAAHAMLSRTTFDVCIVDEATQVLQCTVLRPLFAAKKFILVGDPDQLPPVVRSRAARRLGLEESLFHKLMNEAATSTLQLQYRMNRSLADIANKVAYNGRLKCANDTVAAATISFDVKKLDDIKAPWLRAACSIEPDHAAIFIDMPDMEQTNTVDNSTKFLTNEDEALVIMSLIEALKVGGVKSTDIGVIAPYRDQVAFLRRSLAHAVEVSTVDQFQGRDKSVIIYSCTRKLEDDRKVKEGEVLNDQRRLAVSVTRAKHKLLVVGNSRALLKYAPLQRLIDVCYKITLENNVITDLRNKYKS